MTDRSCKAIRETVSVDPTVSTGFHRIARLKERVLSTIPEITTERAELVTVSYRETESEPIEIRRALALENTLKHLHIFIMDDELIVGHQSEKPRSPSVYPETNVAWIYDDKEMASFESRLQNRLRVPAGVRERLREIADFWHGKTLYEKAWTALPESVKCMRKTGVLSISH